MIEKPSKKGGAVSRVERGSWKTSVRGLGVYFGSLEAGEDGSRWRLWPLLPFHQPSHLPSWGPHPLPYSHCPHTQSQSILCTKEDQRPRWGKRSCKAAGMKFQLYISTLERCLTICTPHPTPCATSLQACRLSLSGPNKIFKIHCLIYTNICETQSRWEFVV